ncbi:MAG: transporter substrate-binding domain-containing protein, partial [Synergistaceae bacterium]|nr:transporter substrate-binding domain-containing protein [Synergistaceae bacterium]
MNKRKPLFLFLAIAMTLSLFGGFPVLAADGEASGAQPAAPSGSKVIEDYAGTKIGVELGDTFDAVAEQLGAGEIISYATQADMLAALDAGKVDAVILPNTVLPQVKSLSNYSLDFLEIPSEYYSQYLAPIFHDETLRDTYNEWAALIKADGSLDLMSDFWFDRTGLPAEEDIPHRVLEPVNGTLNVCDTGNFPPLVYIADDGKVEGFDIDMIERFAEYLGMNLNITTMGYDAIEPYVVSGSADMSACLLAKTPDREKNMIFGDTLLTSYAYLIVKSDPDSPAPQRTYEDFFGKTTAVLTGSIYDDMAENLFNASEILYFANQTDAFNAVKEGKSEIA